MPVLKHTHKNQEPSISSSTSGKKSTGSEVAEFRDNRPIVALQRKIGEEIAHSLQMEQLGAMQAMADRYAGQQFLGAQNVVDTSSTESPIQRATGYEVEARIPIFPVKTCEASGWQNKIASVWFALYRWCWKIALPDAGSRHPPIPTGRGN